LITIISLVAASW